MRISMAQERARHALNEVKRMAEDAKYSLKDKERYVSCVEGLSASILANGLGQTMAFLKAARAEEEGDPRYQVYLSLESWLCRNDPRAPYPGGGDLLEAIVGHSREKYIQAQVEALAYGEWLKKFAVALLKGKETSGGGAAP